MVDDRVIQHRVYCSFNIRNISDDWSDAELLQVKICAMAHAPGHQDVAIPDVIEHFLVIPCRALPEATADAVLIVLVSAPAPVGRMTKINFGNRLSINYPVLISRDKNVVFSTSKMIADGLIIIRNDCDFHGGEPLVRCSLLHH